MTQRRRSFRAPSPLLDGELDLAIQSASENLSAANSPIRDEDMATQTTTMTSHQILQHTGVLMLATANMAPALAMAIRSPG